MKISGFILIIDSYLVRKGLIYVLNRIHGVRVLKEFGASDPFRNYLETHPVDYIVISQPAFRRWSDLFISNPGLLGKTILLEEPLPKDQRSDEPIQEVQASIHIMEKKETLIAKIEGLLDSPGHSLSDNRARELSPRETTIVRLVSMGLTNRQIAAQLFLSPHTVMTHRKNISSKLGIKSVSGLTIYAIVNNIITLDEVSSFPAK